MTFSSESRKHRHMTVGEHRLTLAKARRLDDARARRGQLGHVSTARLAHRTELLRLRRILDSGRYSDSKSFIDSMDSVTTAEARKMVQEHIRALVADGQPSKASDCLSQIGLFIDWSQESATVWKGYAALLDRTFRIVEGALSINESTLGDFVALRGLTGVPVDRKVAISVADSLIALNMDAYVKVGLLAKLCETFSMPVPEKAVHELAYLPIISSSSIEKRPEKALRIYKAAGIRPPIDTQWQVRAALFAKLLSNPAAYAKYAPLMSDIPSETMGPYSPKTAAIVGAMAAPLLKEGFLYGKNARDSGPRGVTMRFDRILSELRLPPESLIEILPARDAAAVSYINGFEVHAPHSFGEAASLLRLGSAGHARMVYDNIERNLFGAVLLLQRHRDTQLSLPV